MSRLFDFEQQKRLARTRVDRPANNRYHPALVFMVHHLLSKGMSHVDIATALGINRDKIRKILKFEETSDKYLEVVLPLLNRVSTEEALNIATMIEDYRSYMRNLALDFYKLVEIIKLQETMLTDFEKMLDTPKGMILAPQDVRNLAVRLAELNDKAMDQALEKILVDESGFFAPQR